MPAGWFWVSHFLSTQPTCQIVVVRRKMLRPRSPRQRQASIGSFIVLLTPQQMVLHWPIKLQAKLLWRQLPTVPHTKANNHQSWVTKAERKSQNKVQFHRAKSISHTQDSRSTSQKQVHKAKAETWFKGEFFQGPGSACQSKTIVTNKDTLPRPLLKSTQPGVPCEEGQSNLLPSSFADLL